jgi:hypothetical protein
MRPLLATCVHARCQWPSAKFVATASSSRKNALLRDVVLNIPLSAPVPQTQAEARLGWKEGED